MATITQTFTPLEAVLPGTNPATYDVIAGTNFPVQCLDYDATTDESAFFFFRAVSYGSGNITITLDWYADTASTANVVWEAQLAAITPDTDTTDVETKAFATLNFVQDTHLGTTGQRVHRATITLSNLDSVAANDYCVLRIARDANSTSATDDMAGDACLLMVGIAYSDT